MKTNEFVTGKVLWLKVALYLHAMNMKLKSQHLLLNAMNVLASHCDHFNEDDVWLNANSIPNEHPNPIGVLTITK